MDASLVRPASIDDTDRRILAAVAAVPAGRVASYGQVAALAGLPRGARRVARALRRAPSGTALPWHRIVGADGRIAIPPGDRHREIQIARLRAEAVTVDGGRVAMARFRWRPDLDAWLWGPDRAAPR